MRNFFRKLTVILQIVLLTSCAVLTALSFSEGADCYADESPDYEALYEERKLLPITSNEIENWPQGPSIGAESAILLNADNGTILYEKNIYEKLYPASITKLLTTLIAMERCSLSEEVYFSSAAIDAVPSDGSNAAMHPGETLTMEQSLFAILVGSANEVANAVAEHIAGSMEDFALLMNERALELGCVNSHFMNASGLHHDEHYTCAYDMAQIARVFFSSEILCKMSSTSSYFIEANELHPDGNNITSHNKLIPGTSMEYEYIVGSKTGFTSKARQTLVSCAEKDGMRLICVVMMEESPHQFSDTIELFNYGFSNFSNAVIAENETTYTINSSDFFDTDVDILGSSSAILTMSQTDCVLLPGTASFEDLTCELSYESEDPLTVAVLSYSFHGQPVGGTSIRIADAYAPSHFEFESQEPATPTETESSSGFLSQASPVEIEQRDEQRTIYINVKKLIIIIAILTAIIILITYLVSYLKSAPFRVKKRERRRRRGRRKYLEKKPVRYNKTSKNLNFRKNHHGKQNSNIGRNLTHDKRRLSKRSRRRDRRRSF